MTRRVNLAFPKPRLRADQRPNYMENLIGKVAPVERQALRDLCKHGDIVEHEGETFFLAPATAHILDVLAAFEAEAAELESDDEDCCGAHDDDVPHRQPGIPGRTIGIGDAEDAEWSGT